MRQEIVEIGYAYRAGVRLPRRRQFEQATYRAVAPVAIEALEDKDAPVVCRVQGQSEVAGGNGAFDHTIRFSDGMFLRPVLEDDRRTPVTLERLRELGAGQAYWRLNPFVALAKPTEPAEDDFSDLARLETIEQAAPKEVRWSRDGERLAQMQRGVAEGIRIVEGVLYERCAEPRLVVSVQHSTLKFELRTEDGLPERWMAEAFRPDRLAQARRFGARAAKDDNLHRCGTIKEAPRVEVPRPFLLRRSDLVEMAAAHAEALMPRAREIAGWLPGPALQAFVAMREEAARLRGGGADEAVATRFLAALDEVARTAKILSEDYDTDAPHSKLDAFADVAARPLARWRLTEGGPPAPVPLDADEDAALAALGGRP